MNNDIYKQAKEIVCETLEISDEEITDDTKFIDDLGCDSILIIELKTVFEEKYGIEIPKDDVEKLVTLKDVVDYLENRNIA